MATRWAAVGIALAFAACGGADDDAATATTTTTAAERTTTSAPGAELLATGERTPFQPADGRPVELEAGPDGACTAPEQTLDDQEPFFALCQVFEGAGGEFAVITVSRDTDDHDTGILCADDGGFRLVGRAIGTGTPVSTTLELDGVGTMALLSIHDGFVSDATDAVGVVVAQPTGARCPLLHGIGPVAAGAGGVRNPVGRVEVDTPDGTSCVTYDGGFAVAAC